MISKWIALFVLVTSLVAVFTGRLDHGPGMIGILGGIVAIIFIEVWTYQDEKRMKGLEGRVSVLETKTTSLQNVEGLRKLQSPVGKR